MLGESTLPENNSEFAPENGWLEPLRFASVFWHQGPCTDPNLDLLFVVLDPSMHLKRSISESNFTKCPQVAGYCGQSQRIEWSGIS